MRQTYLGNESDQCRQLCTEEWKGGEHLQSDKKQFLKKKAGK